MAQSSGTVNNLVDLINDATDLSTNSFKKSELWWRGQSNSEWPLVPGVYREGRTITYEQNIAARFMLKAHTRYSNCPPDGDWPTWLFLMQHYRLPTRLLDWTESSLIAAFFAVADNPDTDGALWALDPYALNASQTGKSNILTANGEAVRPHYQAVFHVNSPQPAATLAVVGRELDVRMLIQQSVITIHGTANPIETLAGANNFIRKLIVPAASKKVLRAQLSALGFKRHSLFPDLEHLARDIAELRF